MSTDDKLLNNLVVDICRETYDRFVMGGWEPQDAHEMVRNILLEYNGCRIEEGMPGHNPVDDGYCSCGAFCETGTRFRQHLAEVGRAGGGDR